MKVPPNASKVYEGTLFTVYQWEQELFDGKTRTFEMISRPDTLKVIAIQDGKIVYAKEAQPSIGEFYGLLGGRHEPGETHMDGAKRELKEEAGLVSDDWELFRVYEPSHKADWRIHIFIARNCRQVVTPDAEPGEIVTPQYATFDEFLAVVTEENFMERELALELLRLQAKNPDGLRALREQWFKTPDA